MPDDARIPDSTSLPVRAAWGAAILLAASPFLLVALPPLVDAPGHLGQLAIQTAPATNPLHRFFDFHWALRLNLGGDLLVELLYPVLGLARAFWLVTACVPPLTACAVWLLARHANRGRAAAASWALPFAYSYPFLYGFLNYTLGMSLALIAYAGWIALARRPVLREALAWVLIPLLMLCHAIGGGLLPLLIVAAAAGRRALVRPARPFLARDRAAWIGFAREVRPVVAAIVTLLLWLHAGAGGAGTPPVFDFAAKAKGVVLALRDQNRWLDVASLVAVLLVLFLGRRAGARYGRANGLALLALALLFLVMPGELGGASFNDMRLVPPLAIVALTLQDWSAVDVRWRRIVAWSGLALFAVRLMVTATSFAAYDRTYAAERQALPHIDRGARVLALVQRKCGAADNWRMHRLDHLPALVTVERDGWVNAHWDVPSIHLLTVTYRPAPDFYDDPSQYVWPQECIPGRLPRHSLHPLRDTRRTIATTLPLLPLGRVDYLWLIGVPLPAGPWQRDLRLVWGNGRSALYRTRALTPPSA